MVENGSPSCRRIGRREKIEEMGRRNAGKGEEGKGVGILEESEAGVGNAGFIKSRNRRWECRLLTVL